MALPTNPTNTNDQSDADFGIYALNWKDRSKTVFGRRRNIESVNNNLELLFSEQCGLPLKTKLKGAKG